MQCKLNINDPARDFGTYRIVEQRMSVEYVQMHRLTLPCMDIDENLDKK